MTADRGNVLHYCDKCSHESSLHRLEDVLWDSSADGHLLLKWRFVCMGVPDHRFPVPCTCDNFQLREEERA